MEYIKYGEEKNKKMGVKSKERDGNELLLLV